MMNLNKFIDNRVGHLYAVTSGDYVGEMWIFIKDDKTTKHFLATHREDNVTAVNREVPMDKFDFGVKEGIIDYIERVPSKVYKVAQKQFEFNER